jgi:hypothetical protein
VVAREFKRPFQYGDLVLELQPTSSRQEQGVRTTGIEIMRELHDRLAQANGGRSMADLGPADETSIDKVIELWSPRAVLLRP